MNPKPSNINPLPGTLVRGEVRRSRTRTDGVLCRSRESDKGKWRRESVSLTGLLSKMCTGKQSLIRAYNICRSDRRGGKTKPNRWRGGWRVSWPGRRRRPMTTHTKPLIPIEKDLITPSCACLYLGSKPTHVREEICKRKKAIDANLIRQDKVSDISLNTNTTPAAQKTKNQHLPRNVCALVYSLPRRTSQTATFMVESW